jgi:hypothetical protein
MSSQFAESLHKQYVGQTIGWVQITALTDTDKGFLNKVMAACLCKCNTVFERKLSLLIYAKRSRNTASCGCYRKTAMTQERRQATRERKQLEKSLSQTEQQQVQRILDSRRHRVTAIDRREAIDCVIRDRAIGDLLCHGGEAEIL